MWYYDDSIVVMSDYEKILQNDLKKALLRKELFLCYQPMVSMRSRKIYQVEALLRWRHPVRGLLNPMEFIPMAEKTKQIIPIGNWVLENACCQLKEWHDMGFTQMRLSVNISVIQLEQVDFICNIRNILDKYNLLAEYLEFEVTETGCMNFTEIVTENLRVLSKEGIRISMDDFGTGYNSLKNLQQFTVNNIKLDRTFISRINDSINRSIIDTIISLGHELGMRIVAEGIEDEEQYRYLLSRNCDFGQGYYFCEPILPNELIKLMKENN